MGAGVWVWVVGGGWGVGGGAMFCMSARETCTQKPCYVPPFFFGFVCLVFVERGLGRERQGIVCWAIIETMLMN